MGSMGRLERVDMWVGVACGWGDCDLWGYMGIGDVGVVRGDMMGLVVAVRYMWRWGVVGMWGGVMRVYMGYGGMWRCGHVG